MAGYGAISRQKEITDRLRAEGRVSVTGLAEALGVSVVTVRNDLEALEQQNLLQRLRGGAIALHPIRPPPAPSHGLDDENQRIGAMAASLIRPGETVIIDAGATTLALARALPPSLADVTVVTPALDVAMELDAHPGIKVILTGGTLARSQRILVPPFATHVLRQINADTAFLTCAGIDARRGFTTQSSEEAEVKHAIAAAASRIIMLADHSKLGHVATAKIIDLTEAERLITDTGADGDALRTLEQAGLTVVAA